MISLPLHKISAVIRSWLVSVARLSVTGRMLPARKVMGHTATFKTVQRLYVSFSSLQHRGIYALCFAMLDLRLSVLGSYIKKSSCNRSLILAKTKPSLFLPLLVRESECLNLSKSVTAPLSERVTLLNTKTFKRHAVL